MNWFTAALTFIVVWWLVLFMVLPFGNKPPEEIEPGTAPSAPAKPRMAIKALITTLVALLITAAIAWLVDSGLIALRPAG